MTDETTTGVVPSAPYKAIGHGRMIQLDALRVPVVLVFVGRETSEQAQPIVSAVREVYPTVEQLMICNMADVRGIPKLVRKPVEMLMKSSYKDAVDNLEAGRTAEDYVLILPDWDAAAYDAFGVTDVSKLAAVGVVDRSGKIVGMYQSEDAGPQVLSMLAKAGV
jgi:hypothetical protein